MLKYKGIEVNDYKKTYDKYYDLIIKTINEKVDNTVYDYINTMVKDYIILELKDSYKYFEVEYIVIDDKLHRIHYIKELTFEFIDAGKTVKVPMGKQNDYTRSKDTKKVRVSVKEKENDRFRKESI